MALGRCFSESRSGRMRGRCIFVFFADADEEVRAKGSAGNSQKLLCGRVDLDMHKTHTHTHTTRGKHNEPRLDLTADAAGHAKTKHNSTSPEAVCCIVVTHKHIHKLADVCFMFI